MTCSRFSLAVCLSLLFSFRVQAQTFPLPIHGHPEKAAYASPADVLCVSGQFHWDPANTMTGDLTLTAGTTADFYTEQTNLVSLSNGHSHLEPCVPQDAEISGPIVIPFTAQMFHTDGTMIVAVSGNHVRAGSVIWDATGTTTPPSLDGLPMGVVKATGHLTIDPAVNDGTEGWSDGMPGHGYFLNKLSVLTRLNTGAFEHGTVQNRLYSVLRPSEPEQPFVGDGAVAFRVANFVEDATDATLGAGLIGPEYPFGALVMDFGWFPVMNTITTDMPGFFPKGYDYGVATTGEAGTGVMGTLDIRKDMDIHNGIPGSHLNGVSASQLGVGAHSLVFIWSNTSGPLGEPHIAPKQTTAVLLKLNVQVPRIDPNPAWGPWLTGAVKFIDAPRAVKPGQVFPVHVQALNGGTSTWRASDRVFLLATNWDREFWGVPWVYVPRDVPPGDVIDFTFTATAPQQIGLFHMGYTMGTYSDGPFGFANEFPIWITADGSIPTLGVPPPPPPPPLPPPPPPTWQVFTPFFQRLGDTLRVCDSADSTCVVLGTAVTP